tara:strand:+ start:19418 stop:19888 length:471 start_codon:yes stop_codon:yes gene_type:complete
MRKSFFNKIVKDLTEVIGRHWTEVNHFEVDFLQLNFADDTTYKWEHKEEKVSNWKVEINYNQTDIDNYKVDGMGNRRYRKYPVKDRYVAVYFTETLKTGLEVKRTLYLYETETGSIRYDLDTSVNNVQITNITGKLMLGMTMSFGKEIYNTLFNRQ